MHVTNNIRGADMLYAWEIQAIFATAHKELEDELYQTDGISWQHMPTSVIDVKRKVESVCLRYITHHANEEAQKAA